MSSPASSAFAPTRWPTTTSTSQLVAQLIGIATLVGVIFTLSYLCNWIVDVVVGQRVGAKAELAGLDIPEMGALCYPDFQLKAADYNVGASASSPAMAKH